MADEGTMQKELQQLRDTLRSDLQKMLDDQTRFLERLVGEGKPKVQAGVAPPEPAKMSPKLKNNKDSLHLPNAVPKERRDSTESNLEDEMLMDPVMPPGPQKRAKDGWGSEEETEPMAVQTARGGRKSFFQRMHSSLLTHGQEEDDQGALKRMKRGPFYAGEDQDSVILDEEVYDVTNFYKEKGCAQALARSDRFERLTLFVICLNAIYIGVDADNNDAATLIDAAWPYQLCDNLFCIFFTFELAVRFAAFESKRNCIKDMWFVFDSVLVGLMVFETWILTMVLLIAGGAGGGLPTGPLRLLRLLRLSRLVRLLRSLPELLTLVNGMRAASRAVTSALMLVIGLNYVFAIVINMFLSEVADENIEAKFKTLGLSMWSLALHGTFADSIAEILENMRALETVGYEWTLGWSMIFVFFLYVLLTNITVMNMLIGIVCEVVSEVKLKDEKNVAVDYLKRNLRQLLIELDEDQNQQISKKELNAARNMPRAREVLKELDVDLDNLIVLTEPLFEQDVDAGREQEVTREELLNVILDMRGDRDVRMEDLVRLRCDLRRYLSRQFQQLFVHIESQGDKARV